MTIATKLLAPLAALTPFAALAALLTPLAWAEGGSAPSPGGRYAACLTPPRSYTCYRTDEAPTIDGRPDEAVWQQAPATQAFTDIRGAGHPEPAQATRVKMLWDDHCLYIAAELEEHDIRGSLTEHDSIIYRDNDFEVFLDPDGDGRNYFEIENNALGTVMDLIMDKPYRSGGSYFLPWDCRGLKLAVAHDGTLNDSSDRDTKWWVEMAIPFASLAHNGKNPREYGTWRINFSRVQWPQPGQPEENWVWSPTGKVDMHMPERWGYLHFINATAGQAEKASPAPPVDEQACRTLWQYFYAQEEHRAAHGRYALRLQDLGAAPPGQGEGVELEATPSSYLLRLEVPARGELYTLDHQGCFQTAALAPRQVKNWVWLRLKPSEAPEAALARFRKLKRCGISAALFEGYDENTFRLCREAGLEAHLWKWTLNRGDLLDKHPEWYAVNRYGASCYNLPPYVDYYRFLCPSREGVADYLAQDFLAAAKLPHVDGVHLDYVRLPDVMLPPALWGQYGLSQERELPEYDYCYCTHCRERFFEQQGRDPMQSPYPMADASWEQFRLRAVGNVVGRIAGGLRRDGHYVSAAVFPGPSMARRMVRQDWSDWPVDACFPMLYNGFYHEGTDWIGRCVEEAVKATGGRSAIYAGLMFPDVSGDEFERALDAAFDNGAAGVSFFDGPDDEHLEKLRIYLEKRGFKTKD